MEVVGQVSLLNVLLNLVVCVAANFWLFTAVVAWKIRGKRMRFVYLLRTENN